MRITDRYLGKLLLLPLIPIIWTVDGLRATPKKPEDVKVILVQKYLGIGSVINLIPSIKVLRTHFPNAKIISLTFSQQAEIYKITKLVDEIIVINKTSFFHFFTSNMRALFLLWRRRVDISLDFEFFANYSMLISCLCGARRRAGFFNLLSFRSFLLNDPASFNHFRHISSNFLAITEAVGAEAGNDVENITLPSFTDSCRDQLSTLVGELDGPPIIVFNPNTSELCSYRKWPQSNFSELTNRLIKKWPGFRYVYIGSDQEKKEVSEIIDLVEGDASRVINLAGKTDLKCLMALLENASLLLTNDNGPAHMAAGYMTNEVVLFGPETPTLYGPLNKNCRIFYHPPHCSPCLSVFDNKNYKFCPDNVCMKSITIDEVYSTAEDILNRHLTSSAPSDTANEVS